MWKTNPASKPEVLQKTSEVKSNGKYGKIAVIISAADLGPERLDGERPPLWSMDPYEMLHEVHQEQQYREYLEKAAAAKKELEEKIARGEAEASTEAELPVQPPMVTPDDPRGRDGAALMTQSWRTSPSNAKAVESLKVILVCPTQPRRLLKRRSRYKFYGLKEKRRVRGSPIFGIRYIGLNVWREDGTSKPRGSGLGSCSSN